MSNVCIRKSDQGSNHFAETVKTLRAKSPDILIECLTPDFRGDTQCIDMVATSGLDVYAHNIETVERLQRRVRDHRAGYNQSLSVLKRAKDVVPSLITKSSIMLGLGETKDEIQATLRDLRSHAVDVVTFGQYLRPSKGHLPVIEYVTPEAFDEVYTFVYIFIMNSLNIDFESLKYNMSSSGIKSL